MTWQTIDFQGIASLESALSVQLQNFLEEKESNLAHLIANSLSSSSGQAVHPSLSPPSSKYKLSEGVEAFAKRIQQMMGTTYKLPHWRTVAEVLNKGLWEYVELLEGCAVELFQQLEQVGFNSWRPALLSVVESIKDMLTHSMEEVKWAIKRLSSLLIDYRSQTGSKSNFLENLWLKSPFGNPPIDKVLTRNLDRSLKFLQFRYQGFLLRYRQYQELERNIDKGMSKLSDYEILNSIDSDEQYKFRSLYRLLKLWEQNLEIKALPELELVRSIRHLVNSSKACQVFKDYYLALKEYLYSLGRNLKKSDGSTSTSSKEEIQDALGKGRVELHNLGATIAKYREFLLKSDPSPYVRSQASPSDWVIGHQPVNSQRLMNQEYDIEGLDKTYLKFAAALKQESQADNRDFYEQIYATLHDMGQPLASRAMMEVRCQRFVDQLQQLNELTSTDPEAIDKVTQLLARALRADWKYNVLIGNPQFKELYEIHQGLIGISGDRLHQSRIGEFKRLIKQLEKWVKEKKVLQHQHEVELDINDIKNALQDLLAHVQRFTKDPALFTKDNAPYLIQELSRQLLEYRYLFNSFFYQLQHSESDQTLLRNQFLFVDHYFESIENKIIEMRNFNWTTDVSDPQLE